MAFLRLLSEQASTSVQQWPLQRRITTVGAAVDNDIVLQLPNIADHHATITCEADHFTIRRVNRKSAVLVNGSKVRKKKTLQHGDTLELGDISLQFCLLVEPHVNEQDSVPASSEVRRRLKGLKSIHRLSVQLLRTHDFEDLLEAIIDSAIDLTGAAKGFIVLVEDEEWHVRVARGLDSETLLDDNHHVSDSVLRQVIDTREPIVIADARKDAKFGEAQSVINLELCSVLCVPLLDRGNLLGVIYVGNDSVTNLFDEIHLELLSIFAASLSLLIANAILVNDLRHDNRRLQSQLKEKRFGSLIGASKAMEPVFHAIDRVAPTDVTVLITGETGTGKELVANELHRRSNRKDGPCVILNCGAIPANLLESELFGHEKGAFTGASRKKDGKFHAANGGTIFLDEIGEMPLGLQVKLLRVIQERSVSRVGANTAEDIDIRILAATNRHLQERVAQGEFREDLYYRLNVVEIAVPPLRERGDDIILIAHYLIDQISQEFDTGPKKLSPEAIRAIRRFDWPGNVRQLENRLKKAIVLSRGASLGPKDLDLSDDLQLQTRPLAEAKEDFARDYILDVLERNGGNRSQTARDLEIDPRTVFRYLEKISGPDKT